MATTLLDQIRINSAVRQGAKYRTSATAEWTIALKSREAATTARIVVLIDGTETEVDTANRNARILRIIEQILIKENWEGRPVREQVRYALQRANKWLYDQAVDAHKVGRLGASILVAIFTDRDGITVDLLYAGNCRAVLIRTGESYPLTIAHTRGADFAIKTGVPTTGDDQSLTRFLGAAPTLEVDTKVKAPATGGGQATDGSQFKLEFRDRLLLCSARVTPVAVEHFLPHMPTSNSSTIAQELVNSPVEPAVGNATAVVIKRDGGTRRLPLVAVAIVLFALAGLLFLRSQIRAFVFGITPPTATSPTPSATSVPPTMTLTLTVAPTVTPTPSKIATETPIPTQTATVLQTAGTPSATVIGLAKLTPTLTWTPTITPTNTPVWTATPTLTPTESAIPPNTPTVQPVASPTATPTLTPTGVAAPTLKPGPQRIAPRSGEYAYAEGSKEAIPFKWSATRDPNMNEVYHFEITDANGAVVHSNDPVYPPLTEEEDSVDVSVLQGRGWLKWHVRTGVIENGSFKPTSQWSAPIQFKVTVLINNPSKPVPTPTPR